MHVRFLAPDVAMMHSQFRIYGDIDEPERTGIGTRVLRKIDGDWRTVAVQNTDVRAGRRQAVGTYYVRFWLLQRPPVMSVLLGQPLIPELTLGIYAATKSYVLTLSQSLHSESPAPAANLRRRPHRPGKILARRLQHDAWRNDGRACVECSAFR
jgi:hypothetical protein